MIHPERVELETVKEIIRNENQIQAASRAVRREDP